MKSISTFILIFTLISANFFCTQDPPHSNQVTLTTMAGSDQGFADGDGHVAKFNTPTGICVDLQGNIYIADIYNDRIRKITPAGVVSTFAGSTSGYADGNASDAKFNNPTGVVADALGNIYVADMGNHRIRKITEAGLVSTIAGGASGFADGNGAAARFWFPVGICIDNSGNLLIADQINDAVRKITITGTVTTISGGFGYPTGICADPFGNFYVADYEANRIRKISATGVVTTFAGTATAGFAEGTGAAALFDHPFGLCSDPQGNIYIADMLNNRIRKITPDAVVTTLAGSTAGSTNGNLSESLFEGPKGICRDTHGNFYIAEGNRIRKINY